MRYSISKAGVTIFGQELQTYLDKQKVPIISITVHPGDAASEGLLSLASGFMKFLASYILITPAEAAVTPLFAATSNEVRMNAVKYGGKYLEPFGQLADVPKVANDEAQVKGLWDHTTLAVNLHLTKMGLPALQRW